MCEGGFGYSGGGGMGGCVLHLLDLVPMWWFCNLYFFRMFCILNLMIIYGWNFFPCIDIVTYIIIIQIVCVMLDFTYYNLYIEVFRICCKCIWSLVFMITSSRILLPSTLYILHRCGILVNSWSQLLYMTKCQKMFIWSYGHFM